MIIPEPLWHNSPIPSLRVWGAGVSLFEDYLLGVLNGKTWFCLDRAKGNLLWQKKNLGRPDTIKGLQDNIIIATEYRSDNPRAAIFGIYGISLKTQKLLWTSHAPGRWGRFVRMLDFVPDFTNEFRDAPLLVQDNQIVTERGRILNVNTGKDIGKLEPTPELRLSSYDPTTYLITEKYFDCGELGTLYAGTPEQPEKPHIILTWSGKPLQLYLKDKYDNVVWQLDTSQVQEIGEPGYISFKYLKPYIYLVISDQPLYAPISPNERKFEPINSPNGIKYNPALFTLWVLDIRTGQIVQKVPINKEPAISAKIVDCDDNNMFLSYKNPDNNQYTLVNFARDNNKYSQDLC